MRIMIHPGFHKTGTSSLQRGLMAAAETLAPRLRFLLMTDMPDVIQATRRYSKKPTQANLGKFADRFREILQDHDSADARPLLISSEDLSGLIPGKFDITAYDASPDLMETAASVILDSWGETAQIDIWYTTRAPDAWQRSVYYQVLRGIRLTDDFDTYSSATARAARLDDIVAETARRLDGRARVGAGRLEDSAGTPLGPLGALLDRLGIPSDDIAPLPVENVQPAGVAEELLALNRSDLDDEALVEAKRDLLNRHRRQGRTVRNPGK